MLVGNALSIGTENLHILVVDDNPADRELYKQFLIDDFDQSYEFSETGFGREGIKLCKDAEFDCILLDYNLPDLSGVDFLQNLNQKTKSHTPVVMLTGQGDETIAVNALRAGASDYLPKRAVSTDSLKRAIGNAVEKYNMRKAIENQTHKLQVKNKELTQKHDEIQRFYQTVSHELKTPLTSMKEFVCIILDGLAGPTTDEQKEYLNLVKESCIQMTNNVNDLLDITRLETGKYRIELEPNNLITLIEQVIKNMKVIADYKQIKITKVIAENLPDVYMDPKRIEQVLVNLINNAIKFTANSGKIEVKADWVSDKSDFVKISIIDNGCGIDNANLKHIFERLYQVNPETSSGLTSSSAEGLGLGLNICKQLVALHKGELSVTSEVDKGSIFTFTLPVYHQETGMHSIIQEIDMKKVLA